VIHAHLVLADRIAEGRVEAWEALLPAPTRAPEGYAEVLSGQEVDRALRFHRRSDGVRYIQRWFWLRCQLAHHLGVDPASLLFTVGRWGKPRLASPLRPRLEFNLSHSGALVALAVSSSWPVGIDIEEVRPGAPVPEECLSPFELREVTSAGSPLERALRFARIWTWHEAALKAEGTGLAGQPPEWQPGQGRRHECLNQAASAPRGLHVQSLPVREGWVGAIAVQFGKARLPCMNTAAPFARGGCTHPDAEARTSVTRR
jgi:4'-phosphopantetheinyl transferase